MPPSKPYKKAVILGAGGFIGVNLAQALDAQEYRLVCFDQAVSPHWPKSAATIAGDFAEMPVGLLNELDHSLVFHLISSCRPVANTLQAAAEVNHDLVTTLRYLEETKARDLCWVFMSSGGTVYGHNDDDRIRESSPTNPVCSYGVLKLAIERYFALYRQLHATDYVVVRAGNPYGPWQNPLGGQGIIAAILYKALKNEVVEIWGDGTNVRDYIYISDLVQGMLAVALAGKAGETYNIGSASGLSINQLIDIIGQTLNVHLKVKYSPARYIDVKRNVLNTTKLIELTGFKPAMNIYSGIEMTTSWLRDNYKL